MSEEQINEWLKAKTMLSELNKKWQKVHDAENKRNECQEQVNQHEERREHLEHEVNQRFEKIENLKKESQREIIKAQDRAQQSKGDVELKKFETLRIQEQLEEAIRIEKETVEVSKKLIKEAEDILKKVEFESEEKRAKFKIEIDDLTKQKQKLEKQREESINRKNQAEDFLAEKVHEAENHSERLRDFYPIYREFNEPGQKEKKVAVLLRGHIRDSFANQRLNEFLHKMQEIFSADIFIQTWAEADASTSWDTNELKELRNRKTTNIKNPIIDQIQAYFTKEVGEATKKIDILDENNLKLIGNLEGNISDSLCPTIGWKRMWAGIYTAFKSMDDYKKEKKIKYDAIINLRFDLFQDDLIDFLNKTMPEGMEHMHPEAYSKKIMLTAIEAVKHRTRDDEVSKSTKQALNYFFQESNFETIKSQLAGKIKHQPVILAFQDIGCDNFIVSNFESQKILVENFYFRLDEMLQKLTPTQNQEKLYKEFAEIFIGVEWLE